MKALFEPNSIAVVGASAEERKIGHIMFRNLIASGFKGELYPINPKAPEILGHKAYPTLTAVPQPIDLAIITVPSTFVPSVMEDAGKKGIKDVIIITAGFKELGKEGAHLEKQIGEIGKKYGIRILGPNCMGIINAHHNMNATFTNIYPKAGPVAISSQSGAVCSSMLDWATKSKVGFSKFVSTGNKVDIDEADLLTYLKDDDQTKVIGMYIEGANRGKAFMRSALKTSRAKPIIVLKSGRTSCGSKAASSHTGALSGSDKVYDAAFRQSGIMRVNTIDEMFDLLQVFANMPLPKGDGLAIVTNAGGPGVLATDALLTSGGELAALSPKLRQSLDAMLPPQWSHNNPIDVLGDAAPERFAKALKTVADDPDNDGVLVILTPQDMTDPTKTAEAIVPLAKLGNKPLLASWMGGAEVAAGQGILSRAGIPTFAYPDAAAHAFSYMWRYAYNLHGLYETPALGDDNEKSVDRAAATAIVDAARAAGKTLLDESESKNLMAAYGLPVTQTLTATSAADAVQAASSLGFPVALKLFSHTITHKTDVGGVKLNLIDGEQVARAFDDIRDSVSRLAGAEHFQGVTVQPMINAREGYELIVGCSPDSQFGPVMLFGSGGQLVEVIKDRSLGLPPLNATLARRLMEQTKIYKALEGVRGRKPVDIPLLCQVLVRFSQLVVEQPWIKEIEINPLIATASQIVAVDARTVLWGPETKAADLPRPAIRPYPTQYLTDWTLRDGTAVRVRPIRPEDEPLLIRFHQELSDRSVMFRFFHPMNLTQRIAHERLIRVCFNDYDRELALVTEGRGDDGKPFILGIGRLSKLAGGKEAEFSIVISDKWQNRGLGTHLLELMEQVARSENIERLFGLIMRQNLEMQRVAEKLGFTLTGDVSESTILARMDLLAPAEAAQPAAAAAAEGS